MTTQIVVVCNRLRLGSSHVTKIPLVVSPSGSWDNDQEAENDGEGEGDPDVYGDAENEEEENEDGFDEQDQDDSQDPYSNNPKKGQPGNSSASENHTSGTTQDGGPSASFQSTSQPNPAILLTSASPTRSMSAANGSVIQPLQVRLEALTASTYDIVPTIAAPHSTSINSITATPDLRWVFSGGADGYIRKFNWIDTVNGKSMLTVAQRHPFVDSVTKAGVLLSYWENEDSQGMPDL